MYFKHVVIKLPPFKNQKTSHLRSLNFIASLEKSQVALVA